MTLTPPLQNKASSTKWNHLDRLVNAMVGMDIGTSSPLETVEKFDLQPTQEPNCLHLSPFYINACLETDYMRTNELNHRFGSDQS